MIAWVLAPGYVLIQVPLYFSLLISLSRGGHCRGIARVKKRGSIPGGKDATARFGLLSRGRIEVRTEIGVLVSWPPGPRFDWARMPRSTRAAIGQIKQTRLDGASCGLASMISPGASGCVNRL
jgi:hypothetical protein